MPSWIQTAGIQNDNVTQEFVPMAPPTQLAPAASEGGGALPQSSSFSVEKLALASRHARKKHILLVAQNVDGDERRKRCVSEPIYSL